jgi:hypothetical protein
LNSQRSWVTPITAGSFLLLGVTGILIFFYLDSGANKFVHRWLSWILLGGALLHTLANFNGLKAHLLFTARPIAGRPGYASSDAGAGQRVQASRVGL